MYIFKGVLHIKFDIIFGRVAYICHLQFLTLFLSPHLSWPSSIFWHGWFCYPLKQLKYLISGMLCPLDFLGYSFPVSCPRILSVRGPQDPVLGSLLFSIFTYSLDYLIQVMALPSICWWFPHLYLQPRHLLWTGCLIHVS